MCVLFVIIVVVIMVVFVVWVDDKWFNDGVVVNVYIV